MKLVLTAIGRHPLTSASLLLVALSSLACDGASDAKTDQTAKADAAVSRTDEKPDAKTDKAKAAAAKDASANAKPAKPKLAKDVSTTTLADMDEEKGADAKADAPKTETSKATDELELRRLVVASKIEEREPVALDDAQTEDPVTAFVELVNPAASEDGVVVTFVHESGTKVGFIELGVPAESQRFRTWGRTRNIKKAGTWEAVVTTRAGRELARQTFEISG